MRVSLRYVDCHIFGNQATLCAKNVRLELIMVVLETTFGNQAGRVGPGQAAWEPGRPCGTRVGRVGTG